MHIENTKLTLSISVEAGSKSKVRMTIPLADLQRAGLEEGGRYEFEVVKPGKIRMYPDPDGTRKVPARLSKSEAATFNIYGSSLGFPVISCHPIELETLLIPGGGIIIPVPSVDDLEERESHTKHSDNRGDWRDAVGHHRGAAAAIVLEAHRYGGSSRPVDLGQLMDLLRNAGLRVEAVNARLFRVDGKSATLADLVERAQRIDADAVLVAEAA